MESITFEMKEYKSEGLGDFMRNNLIEKEIPKKSLKKFWADSGTLMPEYKRKLCDFVINNEEYKYEIFIKENDILKKLIENLYDFIKPRS